MSDGEVYREFRGDCAGTPSGHVWMYRDPAGRCHDLNLGPEADQAAAEAKAEELVAIAKAAAADAAAAAAAELFANKDV